MAKMIKTGSMVVVNYDISNSVLSIPKGTIVKIVGRDILFKTYDLELSNGQYITDVEVNAVSVVE